jgi:branched-chain amino acid transport system substrate-binding protein
VINQSLKEIKLQLGSFVGDEEIQKAGAQLGKRLGVSYIVTVRVSLISETYLVSARLIDVKTGEVLSQSSEEAEGKASVTLKIAQDVGKKLADSTNGLFSGEVGQPMKITIALDATFPPMEMVDENRNVVGFDVDLMNAAAKAGGFSVEFKNTAWDGIFAGLESGKYDAVMSAVTITDERKRTMDFSIPYMNAGQVLTMRTDMRGITTLPELTGKTVGAQVGTTGAFEIDKVKDVFDIHEKTYDEIDFAFEDLANKLIDCVVVDRPTAASYVLQNDKFKGRLATVGSTFTQEYYGVAVKKGNTKILDLINAGLRKAMALGANKSLEAKWLELQSTSSASDLVKIAILAPLSGPVPSFGVSTFKGALLAIREWNAKGGVLGMKITPVVEDSQCTSDPAVSAANKVIIQDKVHFIVGEVCSKASIPVSEIANAAKVIQISPTSTNTAVTVDKNGVTKAYIFRACFIDPFQGIVGAKFALNTLKAKKAFIMYDPANDYVTGLASAFETTFTKLGGKIVGKAIYDGAKDTDFSVILAKVKSYMPDVIYLPDYYNVVNLVTKQAKATGIIAPFMGGDGWDSSDLDVSAADGSYFTNHYDASDPRPEVQTFLKAYGAAYQDVQGNPNIPDALAALAYDATNLLLTAINNANALNTDRVKAAMEAISYNAVTGKTIFDVQHNPVKGAIIMRVTGGKVAFESFVSP